MDLPVLGSLYALGFAVHSGSRAARHARSLRKRQRRSTTVMAILAVVVGVETLTWVSSQIISPTSGTWGAIASALRMITVLVALVVAARCTPYGRRLFSHHLSSPSQPIEKAVARRVETVLAEFDTAEDWDFDLLRQELLVHYLLQVPEFEPLRPPDPLAVPAAST